MTKLKIFTAFSGYDSQMVALKNRLGLDCDLVGWSEIDKYAIEAHDLLFPEYSKRNFGDICKIKWDRVPDFDLFTYSSPCQDFSTAGKMAGGEKGSGTRSSLLWECERAIKAKKPKYLLFENVAAVISSKSIDTFKKWCKKLENLGYSNYYQVLNALDYGVPQRRLRLYMVSIRDGKKYQFPAKIKLNKNLEDIIDSKVDSKYFIKTEGIRSRIESSLKREEKKWGASYRLLTPKDKANCILTKYAGSNDNYLISPTRDHHTGSILSYHKSAHFRTVCTSQTTSTAQWLKYAGQIRRLTPTECFRLMGLNDKEISKLVSSGISDTQLYKLAGNSIVVDVLTAIFGSLFKCPMESTLGKTYSLHYLHGYLGILRDVNMSYETKPIYDKIQVGDVYEGEVRRSNSVVTERLTIAKKRISHGVHCNQYFFSWEDSNGRLWETSVGRLKGYRKVNTNKKQVHL